MWAQANYDLRVDFDVFFQMTPRQFHLLYDRHRESLAHREMLHAFTTAAIVNNSPFARQEPVTPLQYMPNHRDFGAEKQEPATEDQRETNTEYLAKVMQLAAELKAGAGATLERIARGEAV